MLKRVSIAGAGIGTSVAGICFVVYTGEPSFLFSPALSTICKATSLLSTQKVSFSSASGSIRGSSIILSDVHIDISTTGNNSRHIVANMKELMVEMKNCSEWKQWIRSPYKTKIEMDLGKVIEIKNLNITQGAIHITRSITKGKNKNNEEKKGPEWMIYSSLLKDVEIDFIDHITLEDYFNDKTTLNWPHIHIQQFKTLKPFTCGTTKPLGHQILFGAEGTGQIGDTGIISLNRDPISDGILLDASNVPLQHISNYFQFAPFSWITQCSLEINAVLTPITLFDSVERFSTFMKVQENSNESLVDVLPQTSSLLNENEREMKKINKKEKNTLFWTADIRIGLVDVKAELPDAYEIRKSMRHLRLPLPKDDLQLQTIVLPMVSLLDGSNYKFEGELIGRFEKEDSVSIEVSRALVQDLAVKSGSWLVTIVSKTVEKVSKYIQNMK